MTPLPKAPNAPHLLCSAAGELATALNMLGVAPKAPWIWGTPPGSGGLRESYVPFLDVWGCYVHKTCPIVQSMNTPMLPPVDRLSALLDRFRVRASLFHTGALCGIQTFEAQPGRGFLHVLRQGEMEIRHLPGAAGPQRMTLTEPTLLFYPRAMHHEFINPPVAGSDFTCAALDFDGGERNPLVQSLPPVLWVPLNAVEGLRPALDLLFAEADNWC
ncbi:hypothetical protein G6F68_012699 [Rhizopus microsporus]|nr:hypothetical protein G6F68_012699 [Rhizopus microsporus]